VVIILQLKGNKSTPWNASSKDSTISGSIWCLTFGNMEIGVLLFLGVVEWKTRMMIHSGY